jgi:hypothetical protein
LNGRSWPLRLRVPSGNTKNALPWRKASQPDPRQPALIAIAARKRHEASHVEGPDKYRELP